jgi:hypothetical protein
MNGFAEFFAFRWSPRSAGVIALLAAAGVLAGCAETAEPGANSPSDPSGSSTRNSAAVGSEPMYFYPERGQTEAQLDLDRYGCYRWAVEQTGVDPGMQPVQHTPAPAVTPAQRDGGTVVAGAATGAVMGAAMSSPRGPAGPAMVLGAIFGGLLGAAAEESRAQAIEQRQVAQRRDWEARQQPQREFRRAMSACMAGRGYTVR